MLVDNPLPSLHSLHFTSSTSFHFTSSTSFHFATTQSHIHFTHITHSYMFIHFIMYDPLSYIQVSILYYSPFTLVYI
ncbi:hypothetical protein ETTORE_0427 [Pseudomonas phage Ettore]|nr:hypothetical protein ETTORE_0427 [Pseudomonas phage Ettore]